MENQFVLMPVSVQNHQVITALQKCNDITVRFGLQLSPEEMNDLALNRRETLERMGRIEFGGGAIQKIIWEFMDSPFLYQDNYATIILELQECFYYFKNESLDLLTDDELIRVMKKYFDDVCQGSVELLRTTMLENYCRDVRYGTKEYQDQNGYEDNYIDFYDWMGEED